MAVGERERGEEGRRESVCCVVYCVLLLTSLTKEKHGSTSKRQELVTRSTGILSSPTPSFEIIYGTFKNYFVSICTRVYIQTLFLMTVNSTLFSFFIFLFYYFNFYNNNNIIII